MEVAANTARGVDREAVPENKHRIRCIGHIRTRTSLIHSVDRMIGRTRNGYTIHEYSRVSPTIGIDGMAHRRHIALSIHRNDRLRVGRPHVSLRGDL